MVKSVSKKLITKKINQKGGDGELVCPSDLDVSSVASGEIPTALVLLGKIVADPAGVSGFLNDYEALVKSPEEQAKKKAAIEAEKYNFASITFDDIEKKISDKESPIKEKLEELVKALKGLGETITGPQILEEVKKQFPSEAEKKVNPDSQEQDNEELEKEENAGGRKYSKLLGGAKKSKKSSLEELYFKIYINF